MTFDLHFFWVGQRSRTALLYGRRESLGTFTPAHPIKICVCLALHVYTCTCILYAHVYMYITNVHVHVYARQYIVRCVVTTQLSVSLPPSPSRFVQSHTYAGNLADALAVDSGRLNVSKLGMRASRSYNTLSEVAEQESIKSSTRDDGTFQAYGLSPRYSVCGVLVDLQLHTEIYARMYGPLDYGVHA